MPRQKKAEKKKQPTARSVRPLVIFPEFVWQQDQLWFGQEAVGRLSVMQLAQTLPRLQPERKGRWTSDYRNVRLSNWLPLCANADGFVAPISQVLPYGLWEQGGILNRVGEMIEMWNSNKHTLPGGKFPTAAFLRFIREPCRWILKY